LTIVLGELELPHQKRPREAWVKGKKKKEVSWSKDSKKN